MQPNNKSSQNAAELESLLQSIDDYEKKLDLYTAALVPSIDTLELIIKEARIIQETQKCFSVCSKENLNINL